jgi:drug/metabolite transporter (DMT)-like permease
LLKSKFTRLRGPSITETGLDLELGRDVSALSTLTGEQVKTAAPVIPSQVQTRLKMRLKLLTPVLLSVALSMVGQLILKRGMSDMGPVSLTNRSLFETAWSIATDPFVIVGMVIYAVSVLYWLVGLSRVPLSYAYPFISLSYVVILGASFFLLGEQLNLLRISGVIVICLGVLLVAFSNPSDTKKPDSDNDRGARS